MNMLFPETNYSPIRERAEEHHLPELDNSAIAVIGMAGRFPGAGSVSELWNLLKEGREGLSQLSPEELVAAGVNKALIEDPGYVTHRMKMEGADLFDGDFFGYSSRQAANINPQQRVFLECAWEALESAGYVPSEYQNSVGLFAGSSFSGYLLKLMSQQAGSHAEPDLEWILDNDKDFLTARVAYKLGLMGPCITVQTACSTSLVAVHIACQSLLVGECDVALAGGVSIPAQMKGYEYIEHGTLSPDGHCRAFDAGANGTVPGSGVGVVVLRRLEDAISAGHNIHALIKATVVNNDGSQKVGFSAPGLSAQRQILARGLALAALTPSDIEYIEANGTGTFLGDSIELTALKEIYGQSSRRCALGSVKTNIGNLNAAAGVAGLIKAILCLKNKSLVPSLGYITPNPILSDPDCALYVNTRFQQWEADLGRPRRAAVSTFAMGGANAHVILEEAPESAQDHDEETDELLPLSARTPTALDRCAGNLAEFLTQNQDANIADVAYTLQVGRKGFSYRTAIVGRRSTELVAQLRNECRHTTKVTNNRPVIFLFPDTSPQQPGVAKNLYDTDKYFRDEIDSCACRIKTQINFDVRDSLCGEGAHCNNDLTQAAYIQAAWFAFQYSLARMWQNWGLKPVAMLGRGLGEYIAACIAETISWNDAVGIVLEHSRRIDEHRFKSVGFSIESATLQDFDNAAFLEIGHGSALSDFFRQQIRSSEDQIFLSSMSGSGNRAALLKVLGRLWSEGAEIAWNGRRPGRVCRRIDLPPYPFERQRYSQPVPSSMPQQKSHYDSPLQLEDTLLMSNETGPSTELERSLVEIWRELLGDEVGMKDRFLDLGGDSLIAVRMSGRVRALVGVNVSPAFFINVDCTVEALASEIVAMLLAAHGAKAVRQGI